MSEYDLIPTKDYKAICDAIRAKDSSSGLIKSGEAAQKITNLIVADQLISNNVTEIKSDLSQLKPYAFAESTLLKKADFPNLTQVPKNCFSGCISLEETNFPQITNVGDYGFSNTLINKLDSSLITNIGESAFYECNGLENIFLENLVEIGRSAFSKCAKLKTISIPQVTYLSDRAFESDWNLQEIYSPKIETVGYDSFAYSGFLKGYFPSLKLIDAKGFKDCGHLESLILKNNIMCILTDETCLQKTPIEEGKGYVYVPKNLLSTYQSDPIWSKYSNQIKAIEDYPIETNDTTINIILFRGALQNFEGIIQFSQEISPISDNFLNFEKTVTYKIENNIATIYCTEQGKKVYAPIDCAEMFMNFKASTIDCTNLDFSLTKFAKRMFNITTTDSIILSNMPSLTDVHEMFYKAISNSVNINAITSYNIENMASMFNSCTINNIDLSTLNTSKVTNTAYMFGYFTTESNLDCSNFNVSKVTDMHKMFKSTRTPSIDVSNFDTSHNPRMDFAFDSKTDVIYCRNQEEIDRYKANANPQPNINFIIKQQEKI